MRKLRLLYFVLTIITIPLGLGSRIYDNDLPQIITAYAGDVLYATLIFFILRLIWPFGKMWKTTAICYFICIAIETLQLYQAPWFQKIRYTPPMGLILGYGFLWSDWVSYAIGTFLGWLVSASAEKLLRTIGRGKT